MANNAKAEKMTGLNWRADVIEYQRVEPTGAEVVPVYAYVLHESATAHEYWCVRLERRIRRSELAGGGFDLSEPDSYLWAIMDLSGSSLSKTPDESGDFDWVPASAGMDFDDCRWETAAEALKFWQVHREHICANPIEFQSRHIRRRLEKEWKQDDPSK